MRQLSLKLMGLEYSGSQVVPRETLTDNEKAIFNKNTKRRKKVGFGKTHIHGTAILYNPQASM